MIKKIKQFINLFKMQEVKSEEKWNFTLGGENKLKARHCQALLFELIKLTQIVSEAYDKKAITDLDIITTKEGSFDFLFEITASCYPIMAFLANHLIENKEEILLARHILKNLKLKKTA